MNDELNAAHHAMFPRLVHEEVFVRAGSTPVQTAPLDHTMLPSPNDTYDDAIVVASVWLNDDLLPFTGTALILLLRKTPGEFYAVCNIEWIDGGWKTINEQSHPNIVPAVRDYEQERRRLLNNATHPK